MKMGLEKLTAAISNAERQVTLLEKRKTPAKKIADWADYHYALKMQRDALKKLHSRVIAVLERVEGQAKEVYEGQNLEGARGDSALAFLQDLDHVRLDDRRKLDAYVKRTGHFELYQNRVSKEAYDELVASGKKPAGVRVETLTYFRTRKR